MVIVRAKCIHNDFVGITGYFEEGKVKENVMFYQYVFVEPTLKKWRINIYA